jgi:glycosyltransferase involved in cell wall biosynthesis
LLIDDSSADDTAGVALAAAREFELPLRRIAAAVGNAGAARNIGLTQCEAPLVYFLDADDEVAAGGLHHLVEALTSDTGRTLALGTAIRRTGGRPDKPKTPQQALADRHGKRTLSTRPRPLSALPRESAARRG